MNRFNRTAVYQIAAIISGVACLLFSVLLYKHYTEYAFTPTLDFLSSFNLALPPAAILITTYVVAIVTGKSVSDAPRHVLTWLRNVFFQSSGLMLIAVIVAAILGVTTAFVSFKTAPPAYTELVQTILGGESDDFKPANLKVDAIAKKNQALADQFRSVIRVFEYRHGLTSGGNAAPKAAVIRILVRTLETTDDRAWQEHPLRSHALAEAYSLYASVFETHPALMGSTGINGKSLSEKARLQYERVISSQSPLAIPLLRSSATLNLGNIYYRDNDLERALAFWRQSNDESKGWKNTSASGNIVAALVKLGKIKEAVAEGVAAQEWAERTGVALREPNPYAGIVGNTGTARLITGDIPNAIRDMSLVVALVDDALARINLALAFALADRRVEAKGMIALVANDPSPLTQLVSAKGLIGPGCAYLIWDLADPEAPPAQSAGRLLSYLERPTSPDTVKLSTPADVKELRAAALAKLRTDTGECDGFHLIPSVVARLSRP